MKIKKLVSVILVCVMVLGTMSAVAFAEEIGAPSQTESDIIEISTAEQLKNFSEESQKSSFKGKTVILTNDIDMQNISDWQPIGAKARFSGIFDGKNHTISNFKSISNGFHDGGYCNGFFGVLSGATIKNIVFDNAVVECSYSYNYGNIYGIVAAYSYGDKFENITVKNSKVKGFGKVGGILGMAAEPTAKTVVTDCAVYDTEICGTYDAGGIIGLGQGEIIMSGNKIKNITYKPDPLYDYVFLDTEVVCDGSAKTCAGNGTQVYGKHWVFNGYNWGGYSDFYTHYGDSAHDCILKNGEQLANSEIEHNAVAEIDGVKYLTLADAVNDAKDGDVIKVLYDVKGNGTQIPSGKNLTIDFGGHTYTLDNPLVGSENTKTNGFQLLQGSNIVFKNGSLYSEKANILIQNYANLTLEDMNLFLNRVYEKPGQPLYTLSNNNGKIVLTGNTNISALDVNYAFDVCRFSTYPGVSVTLDKNMTGTIDGNIELTGAKKDENDFELVIENGKFNGKIVNSAPTADIRISGGNFANDVKKYVVDGYTTKLVDGRYYVVKAAAKVVDTAKTTGAEVKLNDLHEHDAIDLNSDATYKVVVTTAPAEDVKAANDKINEVGDTNSEKHTFDISVIKTDSEGSKKDVSGTITNQQVTLTLSETPIGGVRVYHVNNAGEVEEITPVTVNGNEVTFIAPSFSTYTATYNTGAVDESTITNKAGVVFSPVAEGSNEYYITLKALENGKKINRFMAADIAFKNNSTGVSYEITPAANINVNEVAENEYRFEMNGSSASSVSGEAITIGTVTFGGIGSVDFGVDEAYTGDHSVNIVNTAKSADNVIDHYDIAGGTLVVNDAANKTDYPTIADDESGKISADIKAETANLTVDVMFNNPVGNQAASYQDMKVVISGGDLAAEKTLAIGSDENAVEGGKATVTAELTKNIAYTVTVSGAGYRTARHTVTMTGDKTLKFWNNVLDTAAAVEEGKTPVTKNFLAGDIVKDNKINIYDLSAVVSYYGRTNDTASADAYAKYDLNRDGVIDSKDVAMVLVSWGN